MVRNKKMVGATVLISALALTSCGNDAEDAQAPETASSSVATAPTAETPAGGENLPGAMVGDTGRSWPDENGEFDDSAHAEPGTWSVDWMHQRPVWTPENPEGDLPNESELRSGGFEQCQGGDVQLTGKTEQQWVYARYLAVNDQAGPSRLEEGVPAGFAHSPQGAVMMAINALGYGIGGQGDGVGEEIDRAWWSTYQTLQEDRDFRGLNKPDYDHSQHRPQSMPAPGYYNVISCSENVAVVEVGLDFTAAGQPAMKTTIPLYWRDGDWTPDLSGQAGVTFDKGGTFDPDNPSPLKKVQY